MRKRCMMRRRGRKWSGKRRGGGRGLCSMKMRVSCEYDCGFVEVKVYEGPDTYWVS